MRWLPAGLAVCALWVVGVAVWILDGPADEGHSADFAIVLGAAVVDNRPSPVFAARLDHAIDLYDADRVQGLILTGGQSAEDVVSEAAAARRYAMDRGVPSHAIAIEELSRTTMGNLREARTMMTRIDATSALIVSDPLHLRRAMAMADRLDMQAHAAPTPYTRYRSWQTRLPFLLREVFFLHYFWFFRA